MAPAVNAVLPSLNLLRGEDLLHVDFGRTLANHETVSQVIEVAFDTIVRCGGRYESTGTSKILHMLNPSLFVMWDVGIRKGYGIRGSGDGLVYAQRFLPQMQQLAKSAVVQCMEERGVSEEEAIRFICPCGHSLAKVIDEYNWARYVGGIAESSQQAESGEALETPAPKPVSSPSNSDSDVIARITDRLLQMGGSAEIPLLKAGKSFRADLRPGGVSVDNLGNQPFLPWQVFIETVALLQRNGGAALRGDAMNCKLGDARLALNSVEGHIADAVYGRQKGDSVFRRVSPVAAILEWCGLCCHSRGELRLVK